MAETTSKPLRRRFADWVLTAKDRSLPVAALTLLASIVGALIVVGGSVVAFSAWVQRTTSAELDESVELLESLGPGIPTETFEAALGSPISRWSPEGSSLVEVLWAGDRFYVQVIADELGIAQLYAVTSCADDFRPHGLQGEPLDSFGLDPWEWFFSGATSVSYMFDRQSASNPSLYQETYVGWNDTCRFRLADGCDGLPETLDLWVNSGDADPEFASERERARSCVVPNTWARTAPNAQELPLYSDCVGAGSALRCFTVGPRRTTARTLPGPGGTGD